jgi:hypothetical protein
LDVEDEVQKQGCSKGQSQAANDNLAEASNWTTTSASENISGHNSLFLIIECFVKNKLMFPNQRAFQLTEAIQVH